MSADQNDEGSDGYRKLEHIAARLKAGDNLEPTTVRELLRWFGAERRGVRTNEIIRHALLKTNLRIEPDLNAQTLDGEIQFHSDSSVQTVVNNAIRLELFTVRLANWIDQNPGASERKIQAKARAMKELGFGDLLRDEVDDIVELRNRALLIAPRNGDAPEGHERLRQIAVSLRSGQTVAPITVRKLLQWFGTDRRRLLANYMIRSALRLNNIRTEPDFNAQSLDATIVFREEYKINKLEASELNDMYTNLLLDRLGGWIDQHPEATHADVLAKSEALQKLDFDQLASDESADVIPFPGRQSLPVTEPYAVDPTFRIRNLVKVAPISVSPTQSVKEAMTIMMLHDFSQLPVINGEPKESNVKGVVSWHSIGERLALGEKCAEVRQCVRKAEILSAGTSLLTAIDQIIRHEYVLIADESRKILGIVTTSDLSIQFRELSEPFLLLEEIEKHVRILISMAGFTEKELRDAIDPNDGGRKPDSIHNLSFGEYIWFVERKDSWKKLGLPIDRKAVVEELKKIGQIRNRVMHFSPDPFPQEDIQALRNFVIFLQKVTTHTSPRA
jgi:CBS domain-containing protein